MCDTAADPERHHTEVSQTTLCFRIYLLFGDCVLEMLLSAVPGRKVPKTGAVLHVTQISVIRSDHFNVSTVAPQQEGPGFNS